MKLILYILGPATVLALAACGASSEDEIPVSHVGAGWASANANSVESLVATSDAVIVGTVSELVEQQEVPIGADPAALPQGGSRQARTFPVSVYRVTLEQTISGPAQGEVLVTQAGGIVQDESGARRRLVLEEDEPLAVGARYMFFLVRRPDGTYSSPPFGRFAVEDGRLEAIAGWTAAAGVASLDGRASGEAAREVQSVAQ